MQKFNVHLFSDVPKFSPSVKNNLHLASLHNPVFQQFHNNRTSMCEERCGVDRQSVIILCVLNLFARFRNIMYVKVKNTENDRSLSFHKIFCSSSSFREQYTIFSDKICSLEAS